MGLEEDEVDGSAEVVFDSATLCWELATCTSVDCPSMRAKSYSQLLDDETSLTLEMMLKTRDERVLLLLLATGAVLIADGLVVGEVVSSSSDVVTVGGRVGAIAVVDTCEEGAD